MRDSDGCRVVSVFDSHFCGAEDEKNLTHIAKCLNERAELIRAIFLAEISLRNIRLSAIGEQFTHVSVTDLSSEALAFIDELKAKL